MSKLTRFRGTLAYDGTRYAGFQRQGGRTLTIQATLENAIETVHGAPVRVLGAGRTDAGVHARGQVIAFDAAWHHAPAALGRAINAQLPPDIALQTLEAAPAGFHPRYDALSRRYVYRLYAASVRNPLQDRFSWYTGRWALDMPAMQSAAACLLGVHDFATFGQPTQGDVTIREVYRAEVGAGAQAGELVFTVEANAFLKRMIRSLVGSLVEVGRGRWQITDMADALHATDRARSGPTAPPHGLVFEAVRYE
ncbi:MAG: tRNA pseudouridine(38-40) synthase TruA [Anaerolineales bacterium]